MDYANSFENRASSFLFAMNKYGYGLLQELNTAKKNWEDSGWRWSVF